jgi:hypothetical protein
MTDVEINNFPRLKVKTKSVRDASNQYRAQQWHNNIVNIAKVNFLPIAQ